MPANGAPIAAPAQAPEGPSTTIPVNAPATTASPRSLPELRSGERTKIKTGTIIKRKENFLQIAICFPFHAEKSRKKRVNSKPRAKILTQDRILFIDTINHRHRELAES
jgi:hypothetical protein